MWPWDEHVIAHSRPVACMYVYSLVCMCCVCFKGVIPSKLIQANSRCCVLQRGGGAVFGQEDLDAKHLAWLAAGRLCSRLLGVFRRIEGRVFCDLAAASSSTGPCQSHACLSWPSRSEFCIEQTAMHSAVFDVVAAVFVTYLLGAVIMLHAIRFLCHHELHVATPH